MKKLMQHSGIVLGANTPLSAEMPRVLLNVAIAAILFLTLLCTILLVAWYARIFIS